MEHSESMPGDNLEQEPVEYSGKDEQDDLAGRPQDHRVPARGTPTMDDPSSSPEMSLPAEAQGEANGGPLGCCLGVLVGLVLSLLVGVFSRLYADPLAQILHTNLSLVARIVMALIAVAGAIVCGYYGWKFGKRFYREYEPPVVKDRRRKSKAKAAKM